MRPAAAERTLTWLLRIFGGMALLALVPMFMPTSWMEAGNDALGLGPFHRSPLTEYLTRSLSAVYALYGALAVYVTFDLRRYLPVVAWIGGLTALFGIYLTGLDLWAGMPASWTWGEGPPTVAIGLLMAWLARRADDAKEGG